jgi:nucleoside-diphosphate-sugar epimerase
MARRVSSKDGKRRVLLTGATGLIGPKVLDRLVKRGDDVRVLALPDTVDEVDHRDAVEIVPGSLDDAEALKEATSGVEVVHHLAGMLPGADPAEMFRVNVDGTESLLHACVEQKVRRLVFVSSVAVYRPAPFPFMWPLREDSPQAAHGNDELRNYGQSKIDAEAAIMERTEEQGLEHVILRPPVIYGPGAPFVDGLVRQTIERPRAAMLQGARLGVMQWIHARDMAEAIVLAGSRPGAANRAFNVAGDEPITMARLCAIVHEALNPRRKWGVQREAARQLGDHGLRFDITACQEVLGFSPQVRLRDGIAEMLDNADAQSLTANAPRAVRGRLGPSGFGAGSLAEIP